MAMVDPRKRQAERKADGQSEVPELGEGVKRVQSECRVPGAVVGWEHYESSKKGTPGLLVRFVALEGPESGGICERTFWLTDRAVGQLADMMICLGHLDPFDPQNNDHLERAFAKGAVMMDIKGEKWEDQKTGEERTTYRPAWFGKMPKGSGKKEWNEHMVEAEEGWGRYLTWRQNNPRRAAGDNDSGGGGYSSGGGSGSGSGGSSSGGGSSAYDEDEIPFAHCGNCEPAWVQRLL